MTPGTMQAQDVVLRLDRITKRFGALTANDGISLALHRGEVVALLGENGAGKTTLMNILFGHYVADEGGVEVMGAALPPGNPRAALAAGVGMVHQHFTLADNLTVLENIRLGTESLWSRGTARATGRAKVDRLARDFGLAVDADARVGSLTVGERQRVEILKALYREARILILDEPTAVLTPQETDKLFAILRNMRNAGKAIVIITHKMHEVESLSDRVAVLRKGQYVGDVMTRDTNAEELTNMMVGHPVKLNIERTEPVNPRPRIEVKDLIVRNEEGTTKLDHVSFTANSGEILGIAGIAGSGQKELLEAIAGLQPVDSGSISYIEDDGTHVELIGKDPLTIQNMGVSLSFVPEDRLGMGLVGNMDLSDNMMLRTFRKGHSFFTDRKSPRRIAENVVKELEVATPSLSTPIRRLSGGNVQKVLVGREITSAPKVLLTAYAVRGLDIHSSYTIYNLINNQKKQNVAVVYVGEDLDVLVELCDRILVLCGGKVSGIVPGRGADKREIGMMMTRVGGNEHE